MRVSSLRKETDIMIEKHTLNRIYEHYHALGFSNSDLPCLKIIGTFKDEASLYFLTELFKEKSELWEECRTFGLISEAKIKCKTISLLIIYI